ncbi:hypothetical protein BC830DRAFT_906411 [Chytriomyces sp. MP71]|nr:hypothetical protein BC830DRAFT_906411 [Chytriomyces sp. MP71]
MHTDTADPRTTDASVAMDSLLHLETMMEQSGFEDGHRAGVLMGVEEGSDLGRRVATRTAVEVGYYLGVCRELLEVAAMDADVEEEGVVHSRAAKVLDNTVALIETFPKVNDTEQDIVPLLERIRGKFKLAIVLLKMPELKFIESSGANTSVQGRAGEGRDGVREDARQTTSAPPQQRRLSF